MQDFIKGLRLLAAQEGWLIETHDEEDGVRRLIVFRKDDGEVERIATIIVNSEDELLAEVAEGIKEAVQTRLEEELKETTKSGLKLAVKVLSDWLTSFF